MPFGGPEMTLFSNDTRRDILKDGLGAVREIGAGKGQGPPFPAMVRSSVVRDECAAYTGNTRGPGRGGVNGGRFGLR